MSTENIMFELRRSVFESLPQGRIRNHLDSNGGVEAFEIEVMLD